MPGHYKYYNHQEQVTLCYFYQSKITADNGTSYQGEDWLVIQDDLVDQAIDVIVETARTGKIGDGKRFCLRC